MERAWLSGDGRYAVVGGPTDSIALFPGSPAIDAGAPVPGVTADQRGVRRPQGNAPDIGAFESRGFTLTVASGNHQSTPAVSQFHAPLVVTVASPFGEPVTGGRITFAAPTNGPSAVLSSNHATIGTNSGWGTPASNVALVQAADAATGAFPLTNTASLDSALVENCGPSILR